MRHLLAFCIFVTTILAQDESVPPISTLREDVQPLAQALSNINDTTLSLDQQINAYQSYAQFDSLNAAAMAVLAEILQENMTVSSLTKIPDDDQSVDSATPLAFWVVSLATWVTTTADDLVGKKQLFIDTCIAPTVLEQAQGLASAAAQFTDLVLTKIPVELVDLGSMFAAPISGALSSAVVAFADQTTLPASCLSTTTTTTSTTTETSTTSSSEASSTTTLTATTTATTSSITTGTVTTVIPPTTSSSTCTTDATDSWATWQPASPSYEASTSISSTSYQVYTPPATYGSSPPVSYSHVSSSVITPSYGTSSASPTSHTAPGGASSSYGSSNPSSPVYVSSITVSPSHSSAGVLSGYTSKGSHATTTSQSPSSPSTSKGLIATYVPNAAAAGKHDHVDKANTFIVLAGAAIVIAVL